jgi:hypothetical protein
MSSADRKKVVPRLSVFAGKAAPGYYIAKLVIRLINAVSRTIVADKELNELLTVCFLPDYSVGLAEIIIPANDIRRVIISLRSLSCKAAADSLVSVSTSRPPERRRLVRPSLRLGYPCVCLELILC